MIQRPSFLIIDDHVVFEHSCIGERREATLNNADWHVVNTDPLTVQPSIACDRCGLHGWITNGWFNGSLGNDHIREAAERGRLVAEAALTIALADEDGTG